MLVMSTGVYSTDVIRDRINDLETGTEWVINKVDFKAPMGLVLVLVLSVIVAYVIQRISKKYDFIYPKEQRENYISSGDKKTGKISDNQVSSMPERDILVTEKQGTVQEATKAIGVPDKNQEEQNNNSDDTKTKWVFSGTLILTVPIFIVIVFSILQSELVTKSRIFNKIAIVDNTSIGSMVEKIIPVAILCAAIFCAVCFAFIISVFRDWIRGGNLGHPQAMFALIFEVIAIALVPFFEKYKTFEYLLKVMTEGGFVGTLVAAVILYFLIWVFLILVTKTGDNTLENRIKEDCKGLMDRIPKIGIGLLESSIRVIEFATVDYIKSIFGVFGIAPEQETKPQKDRNDLEKDKSNRGL